MDSIDVLFDRLAGTLMLYVDNYFLSQTSNNENSKFKVQPTYKVDYEIPEEIINELKNLMKMMKLIKFGITPEYLMYALSHKIVAAEASNKIFIDTTLPNIAERWKELKIPVSKDKNDLDLLTTRMKSIVSHQWEAQEQIEKCKAENDVYSV